MKLFISESLFACALHALKLFSFSHRFWGLGLVLVLTLATPIFASDYCISGCTYYNYNGKNWAVNGATLNLYDASTDTIVATTKSTCYGTYEFDDLDAGTYYVTNSTANSTWTSSVLSDITLSSTNTSVDYYNFSASQYPIQLLSKRIACTCSLAYSYLTVTPVDPVPEPGTISLLIGAVISLGAWMARKRFCK